MSDKLPTMNPERWQEIKQLLFAAMEVEPERQAPFLQAACGADGDLYKQVTHLLDAPDEEGQTLTDSVQRLFSGEEKDDPLVGQCLGQYRLLRVLGSGGMGRVYAGLRDRDFKLTAAIKVIKRGMDTDAVTKAFARERQIVAALSHPSITRLFDGGTTPDGRPYFVMEQVAGKPILDYCNERRLTVSQRLDLFLKVCEAVDFAHRSLVIHRDLKPGNILVTAEGQPKTLRFRHRRLPGCRPRRSGPHSIHGFLYDRGLRQPRTNSR